MAKLLAFQRDIGKVVTIDTVNNTLAVLGLVHPTNVDNTVKFGLRTRNNIAVFRGAAFLAYRESVALEARVALYATGFWVDTVSMVDAMGGYQSPMALHVVQDKLVFISQLNSSAITGLALAVQSSDGTTWSAPVNRALPTTPGNSHGGHSIVWRNAIWVATMDGLLYYDVAGDAFGATVDTGSDSGIVGQEVLMGSFAFWNNDLYFVLPGASMRIYKLASDWGLAAPPAAPAWSNISATGIASAGTFAPGADSSAVCLFVGPADDALYLLYSAQLGTMMAKTTAADHPAFTDVTDPYVPVALRSETHFDISHYVDDRRRVAELHSFLFRSPMSGDTKLLSWDGSSEFAVRTTFTGVSVMPPDERFGALRTYTGWQPGCYILSTSAPFPGRVQIEYEVRDISSRPVDIFGEYSTDGDEWLPMAQGDGDDGNEQISTTPPGQHTFFWDAWRDGLTGTYDNMRMRIVARISGV
jgi:hypothetical protein